METNADRYRASHGGRLSLYSPDGIWRVYGGECKKLYCSDCRLDSRNFERHGRPFCVPAGRIWAPDSCAGRFARLPVGLPLDIRAPMPHSLPADPNPL